MLQDLVDGLAFWMLLAALAGVLIGAGVWALASHGNNHHWSARAAPARSSRPARRS